MTGFLKSSKIIIIAASLSVMMPQMATADLFGDLKKLQNKLENLGKEQSNDSANTQNSNKQSANTQNSSSSANSSSSGSEAARIATASTMIEAICRPIEKKNIYAKLAQPDMKMIMTDFGQSEAELNVMLSQKPNIHMPYVINLGQYKDAFDSAEVTELYGNFLKLPNLRDLAIIAATSKVNTFSKDKKKIVNDAMFAYALIHVYYRNHGGNGALGDKLLLAAAKKNQYGARYIEGVRWANGYGRDVNFTNAVSWMLPTYELSQSRNDDLAQVIGAEFMKIALDSRHPNFQLYADLAESAEEQRRSMEQQFSQSSGNLTNAIFFRNQVHDLTVTRGRLLIQLAEVSNAGVELEKYKAVFTELSNQSDPSNATVTEIVIATNAFQDSLTTQLENTAQLEQAALPQVKSLFAETERYVGVAYQTGLGYTFSVMLLGFENIDMEMINLVQEVGQARGRACEIRQGILNFAARTDVALTATDVQVGTNILAPRKKKKR